MNEITRFEIAKLALHDGDTLVVKIDGSLLVSAADCEAIRERFKPYVPDGVKLCVMSAGMSLHILRRG